jgi:integrase
MSSASTVPNIINPSIVINEPHISLTSNCNMFDVSKPVRNPSNYTSQGKHKATKTEPIRKAEDIAKIKEYLLTKGHKKLRLRNYMMFVLGSSIGLRGCDLLRLQISDVLNPNGTIKDRICTFESKTSKMNYPFINPTAKSAIAEYLRSLPSFSMNDYLIRDIESPDAPNEPLTGNFLYQWITRTCSVLKLPYRLGEHSLRRTFSYWTIKLHPNDTTILATLQEMLNHSSMRTTLHYAGITDEEYNTMYNDIGKFIDNPNIATGSSIPDIEIDNLLDKIDPICQ